LYGLLSAQKSGDDLVRLQQLAQDLRWVARLQGDIKIVERVHDLRRQVIGGQALQELTMLLECSSQYRVNVSTAGRRRRRPPTWWLLRKSRRLQPRCLLCRRTRRLPRLAVVGCSIAR